MLIPLAFILLISAIDIASPPYIHLGPLLVVAPAITASFAGARLTALIGAVAVAAQVVIGLYHGGLTTSNHEAQLVALIMVSAVIVLYCRVRERHGRELTRVRSVSEAVQQVLLRPLPPRLGPLRVATMYLAAEDEAHVGGDLYASARIGRETRLIIGDVRGKGLSAIGDSAHLVGAFRELAHQHRDLTALASGLEKSYCRHLAELAQTDGEVGERFVTALLLDLPDATPIVRLTNCGHPPPLLLTRRQVTPLDVQYSAPPLGMCELPVIRHSLETFAFETGDTLLLYTDGVTEARDHSRAFYPLADRIAHWSTLGPESLLHHVRRDLLDHVGGRLRDDAALIAVQRMPE
ncbi:PP2C family protein-serine/threonine phosphatase [Kitasatospora sp. GP82]|uniref:PP2C family protein-serine/threonine phosphatase n=1 Tax=Kitasatospora sp. GP82 TaxID=3035089 RepID=UPI0024732389|nr:PP2C family protein-serine/threonine phosphatase [Kitasatospora sp. GP82]